MINYMYRFFAILSACASACKIDCGEPQKEEILNAIKQLNNNKSAGPDSIYILYKVYQALKADSKTRADILQPLFKNIYSMRGGTNTKTVERGISG